MKLFKAVKECFDGAVIFNTNINKELQKCLESRQRTWQLDYEKI